MVDNCNGIWNPEGQPFEIPTNARHFVKNHLKSRQKCPDFEWPSFQMVEIRPSKSLDFKCLGISKGQILDFRYLNIGMAIQMSVNAIYMSVK